MLNILSLALQFEIRGLFRNRVGMVALIAYLSIGALAMFLGDRYVAGWRQAIDTAQAAQQESIEEARTYLRTGEGPKDRPWVDLSTPMWQDYYAGTRVHREPGALAGIAAGSVDTAPVAFQVNRRSDPSAGSGYRIENPELAMGSVDLTFVLAILSPLLIGMLGVSIGGREREDRIDRLIIVQAGSVREWLLARLVAVTGIAAASNAILCLVAGFMGGASIQELAVFVALGVGYAALWGGVLALVSAYAQTVRGEALTVGVVWMAVCIVLPTVASEVSLARVQTDFGVAETLDARALSYKAYEMNLEDITSQVYDWYPELAELPAAADEKLSSTARRHATGAVLVSAMAERVASRQDTARTAQRFAEQAAWVSPAVALTLAFERLAGVGPEAASAFQAYSMKAVDERVRWILRTTWNKTNLDRSDFDALIDGSPAPLRWEARFMGTAALALMMWFFAAWVLAIVGLRRAEGRIKPTSGTY